MPPITSVGIRMLGELGSEVEADEHPRRVAARLRRARQHHAAHELDVARVRILPEAEAGGEEPEVLARPTRSSSRARG